MLFIVSSQTYSSILYVISGRWLELFC